MKKITSGFLRSLTTSPYLNFSHEGETILILVTASRHSLVKIQTPLNCFDSVERFQPNPFKLLKNTFRLPRLFPKLFASTCQWQKILEPNQKLTPYSRPLVSYIPMTSFLDKTFLRQAVGEANHILLKTKYQFCILVHRFHVL